MPKPKGGERPQPRTRLLLTYLVAGKREDGTVNIIDARLHLRKPITHSGYVEEKRAAGAALSGRCAWAGCAWARCVNRASADPA